MTSEVIAELRKGVVRPFYLVEIHFTDQICYVWSGTANLQYPASTGPTYLGVGAFGKISTISETQDVQANSVQLSLSGVPTDMLGEAISYCRQGQKVVISIGFLDASGAVIADPIALYVGHMDTVTVDDSPETCEISITAESRLADLKRARVQRYTDDDQQRSRPGDKGFQYQPMIADWNGGWGSGAHP